MKLKPAFLGVVALFLSSSCSPGQGTPNGVSGVNKDLQCSAWISAADQLILQQKVPPDELILKMGLITTMGYLNRYAIPKGLSEPEAFNEAKAERDRLIAEVEPQKIIARARKCIEKAKL